MQTLEYFDCSCYFGKRTVVNPGSFYRVEDLISKMEYYGIGKALVYHSMARECAPVTGNEMLMNDIKNYPSLIPVWVVMPHHTGEFPDPGTLREQLKLSGVRAVRMFPLVTDQNYCISEWNCGELFSMLERCGIPLLIGFDQFKWDELYGLCSSHPDLHVILTDMNYREDRNLYPLLKKFGNLYVETFGYKQHHGIEEICSRFGANRLIFGSGMPLQSGASGVAMINYARIGEEEKRMIASGNLERLLECVRYDR